MKGTVSGQLSKNLLQKEEFDLGEKKERKFAEGYLISQKTESGFKMILTDWRTGPKIKMSFNEEFLKGTNTGSRGPSRPQAE